MNVDPKGASDGTLRTSTRQLGESEQWNDPVIQRAVFRLYRAFLLARDCGRPIAEFSLHLDELRRWGSRPQNCDG